MKLDSVVGVLAVGLLLLFTSLSYSQSQGENVYYVKPSTPDTQCPENATICLTLVEYAEEVEQNLTFNSTFAFLPGDHYLDKNFTVANVASLVLFADSLEETRVICTAPVSLVFEGISHVIISNLTFVSCGSDYYLGLDCDSSDTEACTDAGCYCRNRLNAAALTVLSVQQFELSDCSLKNSRNGALSANTSNLILRRNTFNSNLALDSGGGVHIQRSNLTLTDCEFTNNTANFGGGLLALRSDVTVSGSNMLEGNSAKDGGAGMVMFECSNVVFDGYNSFVDNVVTEVFGDGGGILAFTSDLVFNGNSSFSGNQGGDDGGGISAVNCSMLFNGNNSFIANAARNLGGGISVTRCNVMFDGSVLFQFNSASNGGAGGGVYGGLSTITFTGNSNFEGNIAPNGGGIATLTCNVTFNGESNFDANFAVNVGGGIAAYFGSFDFDGNISFINNTAISGGALSLGGGSILYLHPYTNLNFTSNHAEANGGAIFIDDNNSFEYCFTDEFFVFSDCFFQVLEQDTPELNPPISLYFENNAAENGGNSLYGGVIEFCQLSTLPYVNSDVRGIDVFNQLVTIKDDPPTISSDPLGIFFCNESNSAIFNTRSMFSQVFPGEAIAVPVIALSQRNGSVAAVVLTDFNEPFIATFEDTESAQETDCTCSNLNYTVSLLATEVFVAVTQNVTLYIDDLCAGIRALSTLTIVVDVLPCPDAFELSEETGVCVCENRLQEYTDRCNITDMTIQRSGDFWVGFDSQLEGLILHPHCPFDYCKPQSETVTFTLENSDEQCNYRRSGLLCGACQEGLSVVLGGSRCHKCSDSYLALLIPFAFAGFALVFLLLVCRLTVAVGTINGLVFYANIIAPNRAIFFPQGDTNILTVFIAWINLDLGIETCFYDGMDTYARTWLQFVFPVYIWAIIGSIILASSYFPRVAQLLGSNPVAVLATLILLSYAKIVRTIITAFSLTTLEYPSDETMDVWLYDGNVSYLDGKHVALFLAALFALVFLFLPYIFVLISYQWLQMVSHIRGLRWLNSLRVKSFMDAYHAPYNPEYRYWTGLLLLVRFALLLIFGLNNNGDLSINLLAISASTLGLAIWDWTMGSVYKKRHLNILEGSFILNLGILAAATQHVEQSGGSQATVTYISVSIAFTTFIAILMYHVYEHLKGTKPWKRIVLEQLMETKMWKRISHKPKSGGLNITNEYSLDQLRDMPGEKENVSAPVPTSLPPTSLPPTSTVVTFTELREELLEY